MSQPCPYCSKPTNALKNHVRLTSGNGHGPPGEYPAEFQEAPPQHDSATSSPKHDSKPTEPAEGPETPSSTPKPPTDTNEGALGLTEPEIEHAIAENHDTRSQEETNEGTTTAPENNRPPTLKESPHSDNNYSRCPECNGIMAQPVEGAKFITQEKRRWILPNKQWHLELEADDRYCPDCDLVVENETENVYYGSEYTDAG